MNVSIWRLLLLSWFSDWNLVHISDEIIMGEMSSQNSCSLSSQLSLSFLQSVLCFWSATAVAKQQFIFIRFSYYSHPCLRALFSGRAVYHTQFNSNILNSNSIQEFDFHLKCSTIHDAELQFKFKCMVKFMSDCNLARKAKFVNTYYECWLD